MMKSAAGAHCALEPADMRLAYVALALICLIGVTSVVVDALIPPRHGQHGPFMTSSVHQVLATATTVA